MDKYLFSEICIVFDEDNNVLHFYKDSTDLIMEMKFVVDEFCFVIYTDKKIILTKNNVDEKFYTILEKFMKNNYEFGTTKSFKTDSYLKWYSDCYWANEDPDLCHISYLEIESKNKSIEIQAHNNIYLKSISSCICFSPGGNGQYTRNLKTNTTIQDDFVLDIFQKYISFNKESETKIKSKRITENF